MQSWNQPCITFPPRSFRCWNGQIVELETLVYQWLKHWTKSFSDHNKENLKITIKSCNVTKLWTHLIAKDSGPRADIGIIMWQSWKTLTKMNSFLKKEKYWWCNRERTITQVKWQLQPGLDRDTPIIRNRSNRTQKWERFFNFRAGIFTGWFTGTPGLESMENLG